MHAEDRIDVVVVGAGISGLAVSHLLRERGISVQTLEAGSRPGGVIHSDRVDGRILEYGPQRLRLSDPIAGLVDDLGIEGRIRYAPENLPLYVLRDGSLCEVPRSVSAFLRTDLLSWRGKVRMLGELVSRPGRSSESAGSLFRRKFGREAYRNLIEPLLGGIYASDPDTMPAGAAIEPILALERRDRRLLVTAIKHVLRSADPSPIVSFDDGLQVLPTALYEAHRDVVRLDSRVSNVTQRADGSYRVETPETIVDADHLVMSAPASVGADLLRGIIPQTSHNILTGLRYNPLAIVHLRANHDRRALGYQVRRDDGLATRGVTWNDALFDRDGVHTAFLGGAWDSSIVDADPDSLGETARREFEAIMDVKASVIDVTILERAIPAHDETWGNVDALSWPDRVWFCTNYTGRIGVPGRIRHAGRVADGIESDLDHGKRL